MSIRSSAVTNFVTVKKSNNIKNWYVVSRNYLKTFNTGLVA